MTSQVNEILKKLEKGDINSEEALHEIAVEHQQDQIYNGHFLRIQVSGIDDDQPRVHVRIPLRMLKCKECPKKINFMRLLASALYIATLAAILLFLIQSWNT